MSEDDNLVGKNPRMFVFGRGEKPQKSPQKKGDLTKAELRDWNAGFFAGAIGYANDGNKSEVWQQGWAEAQEELLKVQSEGSTESE